MNNAALWKERFRHFLKEVRTYSKYVFNDHLKFIFVFIIGAGAFYYQKWLETLTPSFETAIVMGIVLGFVLTVGSIQTLLKEADLVYLLPVEEKLKTYFTKAFFFTFMMHLYVIAIVAAALAPLYFQQMKQTGGTYIWIVAILLLVKAWNLFVTWEKSFLTDQNMQRADWFIRFICNSLFVYFLIEHISLISVGIVLAVMAIYLLKIHQMVKRKPMNWEYLIAEEGKKMMLLYRIANMFVDVPALKERVARRKWLDFVLSIIGEKRTYLYLYTRTFLRSGNYFGLYIRLLAIGGILLYFIPFLYGRFIVSIVFLYLIGYQLLSLWKHHRLKIWLDLYPVGIEEKKRDFLSLLRMILCIGSVLFTILFAFATKDIIMTCVLFGVNIAFSIVFVNQYSAKRIKRLS
ncbi:ABC transporter permease [Bacillus cytotoxicus]|uniref:ABC transporter permease n=1 Tax=Bacillus cytotoxicus TaxID=580165 RepID=UPI002448D386|nr:ABC transporter permease [Bacillus cytotoxicus]MDH2883552.1 ABC transporter permease [Bacillus cytotoxicus]